MSQQDVPEGTVTVLFTDLVESTRLNQVLGDERAREIGRRVDEMARAVVAGNRGVVIKEIGDGLMAAFSSARRAVAASRDMQLQIRRLHHDGVDDSVQMRIGLHTGEVMDEDGDLHGETVIIAKRIEGLAPPGGILASETVYGVLGTAREELVDQGSVELKGIAAEWRVWLVPLPAEALDDDVLADNVPTPYVGRVGEREQLRSMLEAAVTGTGSMALIGGPAGLGKSRLAREASEVADQLGMAVYTGHCLDMDAPPPYQPAIDHLEHAARSLTPEGFRQALGVNAPEVAKLLPSLRQRYDDIPPSPDLTPEQERRYMLHGVGEFIERAADNRPLLLIYEDLHWADESTLLLLRHLGSRLSDVPLVVIGTYRDDELRSGRPLTTAIGPLFRDVGAADLRPRLLTADEVETVLTARAGRAAPRELVDLVYAETQGNPFFVEELYRHLRDTGRLVDDEGAWRSGFEIGETEVPHGVRLVIASRLDQLVPEHRKLLASAAVLGRTFRFDDLAAVARADEDDLLDALEAAERAHVIEELAVDDPDDHRFVHEQIRQTLVGELSLARRQRLHLRIVDVLDEGEDTSPIQRAHHLVLAGSSAPTERTVAALVAAAQHNLDALAFEDALHHIDKATALVEAGDRFGLSQLRVAALRGASRFDEALAVLDDELSRADSPDRASALRLQRVQLLNDQYRAGEGLDDIAALVLAVETGDDPELALAVQLARGRAHYILSLDQPGHAEIAREAYEAAYAAAAARDDKANMARALLATTWFTDYWIDYAPIADANVAEALALAEQLGDIDLELDARSASMHRAGVAVDFDRSLALLARLEERRDPVKLNAHCFWMMWQCITTGRFAQAVATCDRGIELADLIGSAPVQYGSLKAIALVEMGRYDEVAAAIAQEVTDDDHPFGQAMASLARSMYLSRLSAWGPAVISLDDTLQRAEAMVRVWMQYWAGSLMAVARAHLGDAIVDEVPDGGALLRHFGEWSNGVTGAQVALAEGDPERALGLAGPATGAETDEPVADHVRALDVVAQAHLALGHHAAALTATDRGLELAESMSFGSFVWRLRIVRAQVLEHLGRPDEAFAEQERATTEFRALAERITEPDLRAWFERQSPAPG